MPTHHLTGSSASFITHRQCLQPFPTKKEDLGNTFLQACIKIIPFMMCYHSVGISSDALAFTYFNKAISLRYTIPSLQSKYITTLLLI
jgi:hypothetical protein